MRENLFLVPVVYPEFEKTVENPIDIYSCSFSSRITKELDNPENVRVWGVKESNMNKKFYDRLEKGDILLFYNSGKYIYHGEVGEKFQSQEISKQYWENIPASLLYSVNNLTPLDLPKEVLNRACDYKENYQPQAISIVDNKPVWKLEQEHGSIENLLSDYRE
jgi:hypothetical protein